MLVNAFKVKLQIYFLLSCTVNKSFLWLSFAQLDGLHVYFDCQSAILFTFSIHNLFCYLFLSGKVFLNCKYTFKQALSAPPDSRRRRLSVSYNRCFSGIGFRRYMVCLLPPVSVPYVNNYRGQISFSMHYLPDKALHKFWMLLIRL